MQSNDLRDFQTWETITKDFVSKSKPILISLRDAGLKTTRLTFWTHVDYMPVFIYDDERNEIGEFTIEILDEEFQKENRTLDYPDLEQRIAESFSKGVLQLKNAGVFDPLTNGKLDIYVGTVDAGDRLVTTIDSNLKED